MKNLRFHRSFVGLMILLFVFTIATINACSQPDNQNLYTVENIDFDFDKWYQDADSLKADCNFPDIYWEDDIFNPDNRDYLLEVCYNNNIYPDNISPLDLQWLFIHRYYSTCQVRTCEWFMWYSDYKGI